MKGYGDEEDCINILAPSITPKYILLEIPVGARELLGALLEELDCENSFLPFSLSR